MAKITDTIKNLIQNEIFQGSAKLKKGNKKAIIVAVCSQKGGVGKTTTAVNLASCLAELHHKQTLIVDLDPQGHVEKSLGAIVQSGMEYTPLSEILTAKNDDLLNGVVSTSIHQLHLTPGDSTLNQTEGVLASKIGREFILDNSLNLAKTHYDYIILDCPPNLGNLTLNALCTADYAVVPCEMSVLAFEGVSDLMETINTVKQRLNKKLEILGVVFTRVDKRNTTMNELVEKNLKQYFKGHNFKSRITINTDLNKAQLKGVPVIQFSKKSSGAKNYSLLAKEFLKKIEGPKKPKKKSS